MAAFERRLIDLFRCTPGTGASTITATTVRLTNSVIGLNGEIVGKGKRYWGTCVDPETLSNTQNAAIIRSDFGQLTPENSMKVMAFRSWLAWFFVEQCITISGTPLRVGFRVPRPEDRILRSRQAPRTISISRMLTRWSTSPKTTENSSVATL